jgi:septal ring factor EnvC (AmiA/AmiB activator)
MVVRTVETIEQYRRCPMTKSTVMLEELVSRLHEQAKELTALRAAVEVQLNRIASMQAELDRLPYARRRHQRLLDLLAQPPSRNGHTRRHASGRARVIAGCF